MYILGYCEKKILLFMATFMVPFIKTKLYSYFVACQEYTSNASKIRVLDQSIPQLGLQS